MGIDATVDNFTIFTRNINNSFIFLHDMNEQLENKFSQIKSDMDVLWRDVNTAASSSSKELQEKIAVLEAENKDLSQKYHDAQSKIEHIESQLESTVSKLDDISKDQKKDIDALQLLDIYLVLMGEVFSAAVHVRILFILHGEKDSYTLDELVRSSGYPALKVRQTVHELRNTQIVEFNEDTATVKLIQRFM